MTRKAQRREEAILSLADRVGTICSIICRHLPRHVLRADLISPAWEGAIKAVDRFESGRGNLGTFADRLIRGQILDYLRSTDHLHRLHRRELKSGKATDNPKFVDIDGLEKRGHYHSRDARGLNAIENALARLDLERLMSRANLTANERSCIVERYLNERAHAEIAKDLGISVSGAWFLTRNALLKLRTATTAQSGS